MSLKKKKKALCPLVTIITPERGVLSSTMPKLPIFHTQKRGWGGTGCSSGPALVLQAVSTKLHSSTAETANYKRMDGQTTVHPPYGGVSDNGALDAEICIIKSSWSVDSGDRRQIQVGHRLRADLHFVHLEGLEGPQWKTCLHSQTCYVLCAVGSYLKTEKTIKNLLEQFTVRRECGVTVSRSQTETLKTRSSAQLQRADVACSRASVPSFQKTKHKKNRNLWTR